MIDENESIVGYKNPQIELGFRTNDLKPKLKISFDAQLDLKKLSPDLDQAQVDLSPELFKQYLPEEVKESKIDRDAAISKDWKPPGQLMQSFDVHNKHYEIWKAPIMDPAARRIWLNLRILVLLFIDGATVNGLDDQETMDRWSLYFLYEKQDADIPTTPYVLAGFTTSYRTWIFPTFKIARYTKMLPSPPSEKSNGTVEKYTPPRLTQDPKTFQFHDKLDRLETSSRERISQFLILPPYQNQSLGSRLYNLVFSDLAKKPFIYEIPVEDPSEDFDAMRDYCDIVYLRSLPSFASLSVASTLPAEVLRKDSSIPRDQILGNGVDLENLRHETKIVKRQFFRMVELHALSTIPPNHRNRARITRKAKSSNENDRKYYFWRLALKHRIYMQNADALDQMEVTEKVDKVEAAVDNQQEEFEERLAGIEKRSKWGGGEERANKAKSKRKRVVIEEEEDDWEDMDAESVASKKPKA